MKKGTGEHMNTYRTPWPWEVPTPEPRVTWGINGYSTMGIVRVELCPDCEELNTGGVVNTSDLCIPCKLAVERRLFSGA